MTREEIIKCIKSKIELYKKGFILEDGREYIDFEAIRGWEWTLKKFETKTETDWDRRIFGYNE